MEQELRNKELRTNEEISRAAEVRERYLMQQQSAEGGMFDNSVIVDKYLEEITPTPPPPVPHARTQPERPPIEWQKDELELEELRHAKTVISNRIYPKYFDTEQGQNFLKL